MCKTKLRFATVAVMLFVVFAASIVRADITTWYVNGPSGDDGNTGAESASPFKTIAKALASAVDGDTILVAEGTYKEGTFTSGGNRYPNLSVTDGRHLTLRATGARDATIIDAEGQSSCLWLNTTQNVNTNVVVEGFTLKNGQGSFLTGVAKLGGGAVGGWLKRCRMVDCDTAGYGGGAAYAKLEDCVVEGCYAKYGGAGLYNCEADRCRIVGNVISNYPYAVYGAGVYRGTTANSLIAYNLIDETCLSDGWGAGAASGAKLINCTVFANTNNAVLPHGGGLDNYSNWANQCNDIFFGNVAKGEVSDVCVGNDYALRFFNCCTNDPSFVDAAGGDFTLRPTSVCHNAGDNTYVSGTLDLAGTARIQEEIVDIGAYEYTPIMTITAAPTQATAGTPYSYTLTQTGGAEPVAWSIDASVPMIGETVAAKSFAATGEKIFDGSGGEQNRIDLPFAFPYGGKSYMRAYVNNYGYIALDDGSYRAFGGYYYTITDPTILERPLIMPYFNYDWGTTFEGGGVFVDRSVAGQVTIRWATHYSSEDYRANFSVTLYMDGSIRFAYGSIDAGYGTPRIVGLSYGDGKQYLDVRPLYIGSSCEDILFRPLSIPDGLSVSGNRLVGTMTKGGSYLFNLTATEKGGEKQKKVVSLDVLSNYTLKFDGNGQKTGTPPADKKLTSVEEYVLPEPGMACGCARFLGWATNETAAATYQPGDTVKCLTSEDGGSVTLYATWENVFILAFDNNASGAVGEHVFYTNAIGKTFTIYRDQGATTNIVDFGTKYFPYRIGWWLKNWNLRQDGTGAAFLANATSYSWWQSVSSTDFGAQRGDVITLYAQWFESDWDFYTLDPQLNGGKWQIRVRGDEYAELLGVSGEFTWSDSVTLPASYGGRAIASLASSFYYMYHGVETTLKHVTIPEGYTNLCENAFQNLHALESIRFPSTLKDIPLYCCYQCEKLTTVHFAEGNRRIGGSAFYKCFGLTAINLPRGLTSLEYNEFYYCTNLTEFVLSPDYVGSSTASYVLYGCPIAKLEIPTSCAGFGYYALNAVAALRFLGDRPTWNVHSANQGKATLFEFPATNATWNAGKINNYSSVPHKGFVGPIAAFGVSDAYFWTNANETVTFAYAESPLAATVTVPEGPISWGGVDWELVGFEPDAFAGQPTTAVYYPIAEYAKWEQVTPPAGITLAPVPGTCFTLNFQVNGGEAYVTAMTFPPNATRALPSEKPAKSGFKFLGWATTSAGTPVYQAGDDYTAGTAGVSATLYAKWEEVGNYTIRFNGNSAYATGVPEDIVTAVETTPAIPSSVPSREGWTFSGWTNAVNANVYQPGDTFDEACTKDQVFTLHAKWTEPDSPVVGLTYTDGDGTRWTYRRKGDSVWVVDVVPGPSVENLVLPASIKGSKTVAKAPGFNLPERIDGLWWHFTIVSDAAYITGHTGTVPAVLVIPSQLGGKDVVGFQGQSQFQNVAALVSVEFPSTFTEIYRYQFDRCANLETVIFHEGLKTMDDSFRFCPKLGEIDFPESFTGYTNANSFDGSGTERGFDANGLRFADTAHEILIAVDKTRKGAIVIPDGVWLYTYSALTYNTMMTSCTIPESLKLGYDMFYGSTLTEASVADSVTRAGNNATAGTSTITNVIVRGGAPGWNLKSYFKGLKTVSYPANRAADWADYKAAHKDVNYVEICVGQTVGRYFEYNLEDDLGIKIDADYLAGDKTAVKIEGLAKGLKLVTTPVKLIVGTKSVSRSVYTLEGVPTEVIDFAKNPMYARVTVTKGKVRTETLQPIALSIEPASVRALTAGALGVVYEPIDIAELWPEVADAAENPKDWTFKTWPAGLSLKNGVVSGKPAKAGEFAITATHKRKLADGKTTVSETYSAMFTVWGDDDATDFRYTDQAYEPTETKVLGATVTGVSGQPTGIKFDKNSGKLSGTPTKSGVYATTVTYSDKTKKTFLWKVTEGENKGFLRTMDWAVEDSAVTVMQGAIRDDWTCSLPADAKVTATALPTGLKLAQDRSTGVWTLSGTPTAVGNYVATFKTVRNGVTVTERLAFVVTANEWTGSWYGLQLGGDVSASLLGEVTVSANGTVKLIYTEGTTNVNAKGVLVSQVTKTTVTVKSLDANGTTATLVLPKDKKDPLSDDRTCVIDFENEKMTIDGLRTMDIYEKVMDGLFSEVETVVAEEVLANEEGVSETNAYAYVTLTYNAKNATFALAGKLWDGTAVKGTAQALAYDCISPVMVIDKVKNAITFTFGYHGEVLNMFVRENGQLVSIGRSEFDPWTGSFAASGLKGKKFNQLTTDDQLVILVEADTVDAASSPRQEELVLDLSDKDRAAAVSAQGLVKFTITDADGWKWVCELLPIDNATETQFRGIATGTMSGQATQYCPVFTRW